MACNLLINGIYWGYIGGITHLLTGRGSHLKLCFLQPLLCPLISQVRLKNVVQLQPRWRMHVPFIEPAFVKWALNRQLFKKTTLGWILCATWFCCIEFSWNTYRQIKISTLTKHITNTSHIASYSCKRLFFQILTQQKLISSLRVSLNSAFHFVIKKQPKWPRLPLCVAGFAKSGAKCPSSRSWRVWTAHSHKMG